MKLGGDAGEVSKQVGEDEPASLSRVEVPGKKESDCSVAFSSFHCNLARGLPATRRRCLPGAAPGGAGPSQFQPGG